MVCVKRIEGVQLENVGDGEAVWIAGEKLDGVSGIHFAFLGDGEIKSRAAAIQEALDHQGISELDAQLVARHARLRDTQLRGSHAKAVSNMHSAFVQSFGGEIFSDATPRKILSPYLLP